jgi:hypothetical protein
MEYECNSKPFGTHELVDDVIEADSAFDAALAFARGNTSQHVVYVRELGSTQTLSITVEAVLPDEHYARSTAFNLSMASLLVHCPEERNRVLARAWMTDAFKYAGKIADFETRVRAVQLLIHFDTFVSQTIVERERSRDRN